uniref:SERTA domain-containing protein n=1 Tax=Varanus komodoensis TaxID=61221 RepID=A0A8D2KQQ4_VARKO
MLGRGLKRKLSDYEENMAGVSSAFDSSRNLPYQLKRQLVLNVCLAKLQTYKMLVEPNLHRSVLIANTVRQIQEEMRQETSQQVNLGSSLSTSPSGYLDLDFMEDVSPPTYLAASGDDQFKPSETPGFRLEDDRQDLKGVECAFGSFEISNSTSYLKDLAIDDIFEDIDTSMYDSDFDCPSLTLKTFPSCNSSSASNIPICRSDLSDLDHIMEILVGMAAPGIIFEWFSKPLQKSYR